MAFGVANLSRSYIKKQAKASYISKYSLLSQSLGDALNNLESNAEKQMYSAGKVVALEDERFGLLSTGRLKRLRDELGVTHLFIVDSKGNFIRSTNENPKLIPNLFSFCPRYPDLLAGKVAVRSMTTPIIPPTPEPKPFKFLSLPNATRTRFIHVGLRVDFIEGMLSKIIRADRNIVGLNLYAPNGVSLGRFSKKGSDLSREKFSLPGKIPAVTETNGEYQIFTKIKSTHPYCCQCDVSGISKNGEYYYVLESKISKAELNARLASIRRFFLFIVFLSLACSFLSARFISRALVRRLEMMASGLRDFKNSKILKGQLKMTGKDEISQLAGEFNNLLYSLNAAQAELIDSKRQAAIGELSSQVAHDIRSPLAALDSVIKDASQLPEEKRLIIRSAVSRIRDIANNLLDKRRESIGSKAIASPVGAVLAEEPASICLLSSLIEPLMTEKRLQYRSRIGLEIDSGMDERSYGLFARVQPVEFRRVLSNLIDNAVEAMGELKSGRVSLALSARGDWVSLGVQDNGRGITRDVLPRLGRKGESHGKSRGSGLGLYHAKTRVESWGGQLRLASKIGEGTLVIVELPKAPAPEWFISELWLHPDEAVVVLDDDASIHQVWQERFESLGQERSASVLHFSTPKEIRDWASQNPKEARLAVYLMDYELLGYAETGLSLAKELGIGERTVLVTSRFDEPEILEECLKLGVRMIPKGLAVLAPIRLAQSPERIWDAVLIDDDPLVRMTWKHAASGAGKKLLSFSSPAEFFRALSGIHRKTAIYIDQELGGQITGIQAAARMTEFGFTEIYLATGHKGIPRRELEHLKGVVGKEPPWQRTSELNPCHF